MERTEQIKAPEVLTSGVNSVTVRLLAGGEYTNPFLVADTDRLRTDLNDTLAGRRPVDNQPISQYSTRERDEYWGDTSFDEAYTQWETGMMDWITESAALVGSNRELYEDRRSVLAGFGINLETFSSQPEALRHTQMESLLDQLQTTDSETNVEGIRDIFHASARMTDDTNTVSIALLRRRLDAMDEFLNSCGYDAKKAIREAVLGQGFIHTNQQEQDLFLDTATQVVNTLTPEQQRALAPVYQEYRVLHPASTEPQQEPQFHIDPNPTLAVSAEALNAARRKQTAHPQELHEDTSPDEAVVYPSRITPVPLPVPQAMQDQQREQISLSEQEEWHGSVRVGSESIPNLEEGNEDAKFVRADKKAFGVFDGVGGSDAGEVASETASTITERELIKFPDELSAVFTEDDAKREMARILQFTHAELVKKSRDDHKTMETTASVVKVLKNGLAIIGNVGDSRVYLLRNNVIEPITLDDGGIRDAYSDNEKYEMKALEIQKRVANAKSSNDLPDEERDFLIDDYKYVVTQALGQTTRDGVLQPIEPRIYTVQIQSGDILLLATDGIHDNETDKEIEGVLVENRNNPQNAAKTLVQRAEEISNMDYQQSVDKGRVSKHKHDDGFTSIVVAIKLPEEDRGIL